MPQTDLAIIQTLPRLQVTSLAAPDKRFPWRVNGNYARKRHALIWTTRGQGRILLSGVQKGIGAHNALFIPAGTAFALDAPQMFGHIVWFAPDLAMEFPSNALHLRPKDVRTHTDISSRIEALQQELMSEKPSQDQAAQAYAQLCLVWLNRHADEAAKKPTKAEILVQNYSALIEARLHDGLKTTDFANELDVTLTHLSRTSKKVSGRTAARLLAERLVVEAKDELSKNDITIAEVSRRLGFSTPGNFTRFFIRNTKQSPQIFKSKITMS